MYSKSPQINQDTNTQRRESLNQKHEWQSLSDNEVRKAIITSFSKKASESDEMSFAIIQEAYKAISDVLNLIYKILIKNDFHSECWREETEVILKKSEKSDYSLPKVYRIITLLNCLDKMTEKIMTIRLSYISQVTDLLDID